MCGIVHGAEGKRAQDKQHARDDEDYLQPRSTRARGLCDGRRCHSRRLARGRVAGAGSATSTKPGLVAERRAAASTKSRHSIGSFTPTAQRKAQSAQSLFLACNFELRQTLFDLAAQPLPQGVTRRNQAQCLALGSNGRGCVTVAKVDRKSTRLN